MSSPCSPPSQLAEHQSCFRVTTIEAERREETREEREAFKRMLAEEIRTQARQKGLKMPVPELNPDSEQ